MMRLVVAALVAMSVTTVSAEPVAPPMACESERRALEMIAVKRANDRSAFELSAARTLADMEIQLKTAASELKAALAEIEKLRKGAP